MNPYVYDEYRLSNRHAKEHFRKTIGAGLMPVVLALWLWLSRFPRGGPGLYSVAGLGVAGLLILWSARDLVRGADRGSPIARRLAARADAWFPAFLIVCQNYFVALTVLVLWFTVSELGFQVSWVQHSLLLFVLVLSPVRRILHGTEPPHPSAFHELLMETLGYLHITAVAFFVAGCVTVVMLPPDRPLTDKLPPTVVLIWVAAVLIAIACVILLIDHVLRKMPPAPEEEKDALD